MVMVNKLIDDRADSMAQQMVSEGLMPESDYQRMIWVQNHEDVAWSADEIAKMFLDDADMYSLKPSQVERFREIAVTSGVAESKVAAQPKALTEEKTDQQQAFDTVSPIQPEDIGNAIGGAANALGSFFDMDKWQQTVGGWFFDNVAVGEEEDVARIDIPRADIKVQNAQQREILRQIEMVTGQRVETVNWKEMGYSSLNEMLEKEYDMSGSEQAAILQAAFDVGVMTRNRNDERFQELEDVAAEEETLLSDDEKRSKKRTFEKLNDQYPGRYVYNETNSQIYQIGAEGGLVNDQGELVAESAAYLDSAELPEGVLPEDISWVEAQTMDTPWTQAGTDIDTYYSFVDVLEHPERYHAGGVGRFASGGGFLGIESLGSGYGVAQAEEVWRQQNTDQIQSELARGGLRAGMMSGAYSDQLIGEGQKVRRPWYDPGDDWALFAGQSPEAIAVEQQKLINMGALEESDVVKGSWGPAEAQVMNQMMTVANSKALKIEDIDVGDWEQMWSSSSSGGAAARRAFVAPTYEKLDPARAQLTIEDTVRRLLGRNATDDELADLGIHMQDMHRQSFQAEVQSLRQEYDATTRAIDTETAQSGGEVQGVDWEAQFQTAFNDRNAAELSRMDRTSDVAQRQQLVGGAMNGFMKTLGGGIGGGTLGGQ